MGAIKRTLELGLIGYISIAGGMFTADKLMTTHSDKYVLEGKDVKILGRDIMERLR